MWLRRFVNDARGNVAPMFALAVVPVIGMVGAAIDYSRASSLRTQMQVALDSAALMLSKEAGGLTTSQIDTKALQYVTAQLNRPEAENVKVTATYSANPTTITITGSASMKADFMKLIGLDKMDIKSNATVTWGSTKLRVALALDNTGSMNSDGKIVALKTATNQLLGILQAAAKNPGDVQVSIVPFSKDVNVGTSHKTATWIDWTAWDAANPSSSGGFCWNGWCWDGSAWVNVGQGGSLPANHNSWNGCITDRDKDYDVKNTTPVAGNKPTMFPAEQYSACTAAIMPLGYDWTSMTSLVNTMVANGTTNQPIGLVWAWHTLSSGAPFNVPAPANDVQQAIILLSDGLNTQNRWNGNGSDVSPEVDARMALVCANVKAAGIQVYAIQVNTGGDPTSTVLKNCASKSEMFYELKTSGAIVTAFNTIGTNLAKLRIVK
jgi:Flp pilus assembly protein TadG